MPDMITRCPKCATAFRISDTLLKSAKGMVRCGSCLSVFNANEHIESRPTPKAAKAAPAAERPQESPVTDQDRQSTADGIERERISDENTFTDRFHAHFTTDDSNAPYTRDNSSAPNQGNPTSPPISITGFLKQQGGTETPLFGADEDTQHAVQPAEIEFNSLFERPKTAHEPVTEDDEPDSGEDESWALELLKDDSEPDIQLKKISEKPKPTGHEPAAKTPITAPTDSLVTPASAVEPHLGEESSLEDGSAAHSLHDNNDSRAIKTPAADVQNALNADGANTPETEAESASPESSETPPTAQQTQEKVAPNAEQPLSSEKSSAPATDIKPSTASPVRARAVHSSPSDAIPRNGSMHAAIAAIEPEPLEVDWEESPSWKKRLLWPALALMAMLALLGQVAWLEFHRLNQVEPYRSFYAVVCQPLNCTLPDLVNRSKIQTSNLVVRSHPEVENALMVDVILQNNADFEQTFPSLLLTFSDLRNEPVASRRLRPDEYLGGELAGQDTMPIRQPIHIGLEIVDPGKEAVSYSIAITD